MRCDHRDDEPRSLNSLVECRLCGVPTRMLGTRLCDNCWEISTRIRGWSLAKLIRFWRKARKA